MKQNYARLPSNFLGMKPMTLRRDAIGFSILKTDRFYREKAFLQAFQAAP